jgi:hypothetical protein
MCLLKFLPSPLYVDLPMDLLCVSEAYYAGFIRWKKLLRMVLTWWIYSQEIRFMLHLFIFFNTNKSYRQSRYYSLHWAHTVWEISPTNSLIAKNVFDGAKRRLVTPTEKKEPIAPDMLLKLYNSVFKDLPLQNFCVFPSYHKLRGAILFSNLIMCRFLFQK